MMTSQVYFFMLLICQKVVCSTAAFCDEYWPEGKDGLYIYKCYSPFLSFFNFSIINGDKARSLTVICTDIEFTSQLKSAQFQHLYRLEEINIDKYNLIEIQPGAFQGLRSLKSIIITSGIVNKTQVEIDEEIFSSTTSLESVEIAMGIFQIPDQLLCGLKNLTFLNWSGNNLQFLDEIGCDQNNTCCSQLQVLGMAQNRLSKIEKKMLQFPQLEVLELRSNDITTIQNDALEKLENLRYFSVGSNNIMEIDANLFEKNVFLGEIDLSFNQLSYLPVNIFHNLKFLQYLHLDRNQLFFNESCKVLFLGLNDLVRLNLSFNQIEYLPLGLFDHLTSLTNLSLENNLLSQLQDMNFNFLSRLQLLNLSSNNIINISTNAFNDLTSLAELDLSNNQLSQIPNLNSLTNLLVLNLPSNNISDIHPDTLTMQTQLLGLNLRGNKIKVLRNQTFKNSLKLFVINLSLNEISEIQDGTFDMLVDLHYLVLSHNEIKRMEKLFKVVKKALNLSNNKIELFDFFSVNSSLETIYLNENKLSQIADPLGQLAHYNLKQFYANKNQISTFCLLYFPMSIQRIELADNNISQINRFSTVVYPKLIYVDLSNNIISEIHFSDIYYKYPGISNQQSIPQINMDGNQLLCSCTNIWLVESRKQNRQYPDITGIGYCTAVGSRLKKLVIAIYIAALKKENMMCEIYEDCPIGCQCFQNAYANDFTVDCYDVTWKYPFPTIPAKSEIIFFDMNKNVELIFGNLTKLTKLRTLYVNNSGLTTIGKDMFKNMPNITELHLEDNELSTITGYEFYFTPNLVKLYLHKNKLQFLSPGAFWNLTKLKNLTLHNNKLLQPKLWTMTQSLSEMTLSKNQFQCDDCDYILQFQQWVTKSDQIYFKDISDTYCSNNLIPIMQYNESRCFEVIKDGRVAIIIVPTMCTFLLLAIAFILLYFYRLEMKIFLYSRYGVRLYYNNKDADVGKMFDAFISYANEDDEWVAKELVPHLEGYNLCLHQINFPAGGFIVDSIVEAVENSCRTIIVLTPNFIKSHWCRFEFDTAHMQSLQDRCKRLIVVILEDVDSEDMDRTIRAYMKTNTYLEINDKLFWNKLRYALPDPKVKMEQESNL